MINSVRERLSSSVSANTPTSPAFASKLSRTSRQVRASVAGSSTPISCRRATSWSRSSSPRSTRAAILSSSKLALVMVQNKASVLKWYTSAGIVSPRWRSSVSATLIPRTTKRRRSCKRAVEASLPHTPLIKQPVLRAVSWHWKQNILGSILCLYLFMSLQRYKVL